MGQGLRPVAWPYAVTAPNLSVAGWFTSQKYMAEHGDVVTKFKEAIKESAQYARDNPDAVRAIIPTYSKISAAAIANATLPQYQTEINRTALQKLLDLGKSDGIIKGNVDINKVIAE
jgi:NitT/TauT family transport system substrate-binding protein